MTTFDVIYSILLLFSIHLLFCLMESVNNKNK